MTHSLPLLPTFIARFIEQWAFKRLPDKDIETTITRHRLYILPTSNSIIFFIILLVILIGAINYENSAGFMLTFLISSIGFLGMINTHQNLNHLNIKVSPVKAVFAGQTASFPLQLQSKNRHEYFNIVFSSKKNKPCHTNVYSEHEKTLIHVPVISNKRGYLPIGCIKVYTEFPLGLFHAWSWINLNAHCLIYPEPDKEALKYTFSGQKNGKISSEKNGYDDFSGIREYQKGDPPKHLAWKAIAKTGTLQTKLFHVEAGNEIWLSWFSLPEKMGTEKRLSILCRWILDAEKQGIKYGLDIPGCKTQPASGKDHRHICLKHLALFNQ